MKVEVRDTASAANPWVTIVTPEFAGIGLQHGWQEGAISFSQLHLTGQPTDPYSVYGKTIQIRFTSLGSSVKLDVVSATDITAFRKVRSGTQRPLIFIPGTMGSKLIGVEGTSQVDYWFPDSTPNRSTRLRRLSLARNRAMGTPWNIYPGDVLSSVYWVLSRPYEPLLDKLTGSGYILNDGHSGVDNDVRPAAQRDQCWRFLELDEEDRPNLYLFAYDWRLDIEHNALKLNALINKCIKYVHPGKKVDILTHSQGGLIARKYLLLESARLGTWSNSRVHSLVTIAAPWLGATNTLWILATGEGVPTISSDLIKEISPTFPSLGQQMPSQAYYRLRQNQPYKVPLLEDLGTDFDHDGRTGKPLSYDTMVDFVNDFSDKNHAVSPIGSMGRSFHEPLLQDDWSSEISPINYYHIIGVQTDLT